MYGVRLPVGTRSDTAASRSPPARRTDAADAAQRLSGGARRGYLGTGAHVPAPDGVAPSAIVAAHAASHPGPLLLQREAAGFLLTRRPCHVRGRPGLAGAGPIKRRGRPAGWGWLLAIGLPRRRSMPSSPLTLELGRSGQL